MAEAEKLYSDSDGNQVTLDVLCRREPAWAANVIRTLRARVGELEAEVRRVRDLINVDRTGLAATLNHIRAIVGGYAWIPAGKWGSYDYTQRTAETLQVEVGHLIESVTSALDRGLNASSNRADSAHHDGPSVPVGPTRGELEARAESADARVRELETQVAALVELLAENDAELAKLGDKYASEDGQRIKELESQLEAAREERELEARLRKLPAFDTLTIAVRFDEERSWIAEWGRPDEAIEYATAAPTLPALLRSILEVEAKSG